MLSANPWNEPVPSAAAQRNREARMTALLARYARTRDAHARQTLILHHQRLVHFVALRFLDRGETLDDLVQVGTLGLIKAIDGFDPERRISFSTYAMPTIVGEIKRHFRDHTWHVKVPRRLQELSIAARRADQVLAGRLGRTPTVAEVAASLGASVDEILEAREVSLASRPRSLDAPLDTGDGAGTATLADILGGMDAGLRDIDSYADLRRAFDRLDAREWAVLQARFFEDLSQRQIAQRLSISQMQVSRLQTRALARLRAILEEDRARRRS